MLEITVLTTGGSGIGALLAHQLAKKGAQVVVLSITEPEYEPTSQRTVPWQC